MWGDDNEDDQELDDSEVKGKSQEYSREYLKMECTKSEIFSIYFIPFSPKFLLCT